MSESKTYDKLLSEFHEKNEKMSLKNQMNFKEVLNEVTIQKNRKKNKKVQRSHQLEKLLKSRSCSPRPSLSFEKTTTQSKTTTWVQNESLEERVQLLELEKNSLHQQIEDLKVGISRVNEEKSLLTDEIRLLDDKEVSIMHTLIESKKNLQQLSLLICQQKQQDEKDYPFYEKKINELNETLKEVHQDNVLKSKTYQMKCEGQQSQRANTFLGTILSWQKESYKLKQLPKKLYSKDSVQWMLRTLYLIGRLSELNYGNIIEHLISISASHEEHTPNSTERHPLNKTGGKQKKEVMFYQSQSGEEMEIQHVIRVLEKELIKNSESKLLSKVKVIEFYERNGVVLNEAMVKKVVSHFLLLTSWFSRIEKRNNQLSESLKQLQRTEDELKREICDIALSAEQKNINYLQERENSISETMGKTRNNCRTIFQFNMNCFELIHRFKNLNKIFDQIVKSTNIKTFKKTYHENLDEQTFLNKFIKSLSKSPQMINLEWSNAMKKVNMLSSSGNIIVQKYQSFQIKPDQEVYLENLMKNDLLRVYARPSMYNYKRSFVQNFQLTFDQVLQKECSVIEKLYQILNGLISFSKNGIRDFDKIKESLKEERQKKALPNQDDNKQSFNPLLKILQSSGAKLDSYFIKDGIKQEEDKSLQNNFCVESKEYFRRDNFKLIEKLQRIDLRSKGVQIRKPLACDTSLQLETFNSYSNTTFTTFTTLPNSRQSCHLKSARKSLRRREPRMSDSSFKTTRHNHVSLVREKESMRKKDLRDLLKNISNIASDNQKYRIRKNIQLSKDKENSLNSSRIF